MLAFKINRTTEKEFIYQQLYRQLKEAILRKDILPHEQLPTKRELSQELCVSLNSVNTAYQQLVAEGFVYAIERQGYFAEKLDRIEGVVDEKPRLPEELKEGSKTSFDISFSHMIIDAEHFPIKNWAKCENEALMKHLDVHHTYSHPKGLYSLRASIIRHISLTRGVNAHPEQVILGAGTQELMRLLTTLLPDKAHYAMEEPGYQRIYELLKREGKQITTIPLDNTGVRISKLRTVSPDILFTTPSHQFPTGIIMPASRRIQILNWANGGDHRYIIEDDYDSDFKYDADSIPSLQSLDRNERVIYIGTFSKSLLPGLRLSYMVLPVKLLEKYQAMAPSLIQSCSTIQQLSLQTFIEEGHYQRHIKKMKQVYKEKRETIVQELKRTFRRSVRIRGAKSGLHFLASFQTDRSEEEILQRARALRLELYSLQRFRLQSSRTFEEPPTFLIGFAGLPFAEIKEGVSRLYSAVHGSP